MERDKFYETLRYDKRIIELRMSKGRLSRKDYEEYLKSLPDVSHKAEPLFVDAGQGQGREDARKAG